MDVRDIVSLLDKTAQFVARNGPEFEEQILKNERGNRTFSFLLSGDPWNAYYQARVEDFRTQLLQAPAPGVATAAAPPEGGAAVAPTTYTEEVPPSPPGEPDRASN